MAFPEVVAYGSGSEAELLSSTFSSRSRLVDLQVPATALQQPLQADWRPPRALAEPLRYARRLALAALPQRARHALCLQSQLEAAVEASVVPKLPRQPLISPARRRATQKRAYQQQSRVCASFVFPRQIPSLPLVGSGK